MRLTQKVALMHEARGAVQRRAQIDNHAPHTTRIAWLMLG
jgi:hypothetical protein